MREAPPHFLPHTPLRPHKYPDRKALANLNPHARDIYTLWSLKTRLNCFGDTSANVQHTMTFKMATQTVINPSLSLQWEKPDVIVHSWLIMPFLSLAFIAVMHDVTQRVCGIF